MKIFEYVDSDYSVSSDKISIKTDLLSGIISAFSSMPMFRNKHRREEEKRRLERSKEQSKILNELIPKVLTLFNKTAEDMFINGKLSSDLFMNASAASITSIFSIPREYEYTISELTSSLASLDLVVTRVEEKKSAKVLNSPILLSIRKK